VLAFCSSAITTTLYGNRFVGAAPLLAILGANQILVYTNILLTTLIVARGKNVTLLYITLAMLIFNIGINFIVIPGYGALGAAVTTGLTELVGTVGCLLLTSTTGVFIRTITRLAIPSLICGGLLAMLSAGAAPSFALAVSIAAALAAYFSLIAL